MKFTQNLTVIILLAWVISLVVRVVLPEAASTFLGLDAVVLVVVGYYFSNSAVSKRRNGNGVSI